MAEEKKEFEYSCGEIKPNWLFADLHIHSRFSRACSKDLTIPNLVKWARIKGLGLLGTGDFTHNLWVDEIKNYLKERGGIFYYKDEKGEFPFILSSEISLVYTGKNGRGKRIHLVYLAPNLDVVNKINSWLDTKGRRDYDGRPIFKISCRDFAAKMEEIDSRIEVIPAHIWTPWFGLFGSKGGYDSIKEAFEDKTYLIHAIETGISSDPEMNWKIKDLDNISILSFSDSHSFWPFRLGREASIFSLDKVSSLSSDNEGQGRITYDGIIKQIRENSYVGTIETDPAYGKYHYDGHLNCNFSSSPEETKKLNGICPVCGKPLIIGVEYRVDALTKKGIAKHENKKCYYKILPLHEIISLGLGVGLNSKATWKIYNELILKFGNELNILINISREEIFNVIKNRLVADLIILNREGKIEVKPGFDGVYGKALIGGKEVLVEQGAESTCNVDDSNKPGKNKNSVVQKKLF